MEKLRKQKNNIIKAFFEPSYSIAWMVSLGITILFWEKPVIWLLGIGFLYLTGIMQHKYEKNKDDQPIIQKHNKKTQLFGEKNHHTA